MSTIEHVFEIGLRAGSSVTIELAQLHGWDSAEAGVTRDVNASLTVAEQEILFDAVQRIVALRLPPNDLSSLPGLVHAAAEQCRTPECQVCRGGAS
ncbi:hypothetical protein [Sphaerisporangium dianthi]|uniref:Uncharacterized protein n=1 Tax=Sphaerisporangium dianthi TaxID=1436120 RepID=A0ABV9CTH8_9ACTN